MLRGGPQWIGMVLGINRVDGCGSNGEDQIGLLPRLGCFNRGFGLGSRRPESYPCNDPPRIELRGLFVGQGQETGDILERVGCSFERH